MHGTGGDGSEKCGTEGAGLVAAGDFHRPAGHISVNLHQEGIFYGEAAAVDDFAHGNLEFGDPVDDRKGAEGGCLDKRPVDLRRGGVKGLADEESGKAGIHENCPIAVVPIEGEEAMLSGLKTGRGIRERSEFVVERFSEAFGCQASDKPKEDVADGGLPGFDAVGIGEDGTFDDSADAGDIGQGAVGGPDHHVARAGSQNLYQRSELDSGTDGAHVGVERADGDRDFWFKPQT